MKKRILTILIIAILLIIAFYIVKSFSTPAQAARPTSPTTIGQTKSWGLTAVKADQVWPTGNTGKGIKVGIMTLWIDASHPDLAANVKGGVYTKAQKTANDEGTQLAGIIGAVNNDIGVIGIAPEVSMYDIQIAFNKQDGSYTASAIKGIQWAIDNGIQVLLIRPIDPVDSLDFYNAIIAAKNAGIVVITSSSNNSYPGNYSEVITVSNVNKSNTPQWSGSGSTVDISGPGSYVLTTSTQGRNEYIEAVAGSTGAAHVAGVAALILGTTPGTHYDVNLDGKWQPDEVEHKLKDTAKDIGVVGWDQDTGWGLVDAYAAVQP